MAKIDKFIDSQQPANQIKALEKIIQEQAATIDRMRSAGRKKAPKASGRTKGKASFVRLLFGDVHGEHLDKAAVAAFLADVSILQPKEIVCIGDLIDCGGFLSAHKTLGVVAELAITYEEDVAAGNMILDELQTRAPGAPFVYIEGNHENRVNRWICEQVLGNAANADYLRRLFGTAAVLNLEKRGVRFIERHSHYDGLSISGAVKLAPHGIATHGEQACGKYASNRLLERLGESVFHGHTHRLGAVYAERVTGPIGAFNTGCLCQLRPLYMLTKTTDWMHGYVAQVCSNDGFLAVPVPIIGGRSYLEPLARLLKL